MNSRSKTEGAYLQWLYDQVNRRGKDPHYRDLIELLHNVDFYGLIPNDDNRAIDGVKLRECFEMETGISIENIMDKNCTILEMLIALAERMDYILYDPELGNRTSKWFWLFISNLELVVLSKYEEDYERKKRLNNSILKRLLDRTYAFNGRGGLFPLNRPREDQRKVEIWYQMMAYMDDADL